MADKAFDPAAIIAAGPTSVGNINDQMQVEIPPPSPEGDKVVNFDAFEDIKTGNKVDKKEVTKETEKLVVDEDKKKVDADLKLEEEKALKIQQEKEAKAKEEDSPKPPLTAKTTPKIEENGKIDIDFKDYVPEAAIPLLKKASKETQEFIIAEFKRNKTALDSAKAEIETAKKSVREGLPTSWYEHENAFMLTPEYQAAVGKSNTLRSYADHFRQQLINIKEGEKWVDLILGPDGKPQQQVREPGSAAEVNVLDRINKFENALNQEQQQAANIAYRFRQQVTSLRGDMQKAEDEYFPQYSKDFDKNEHGQYVIKVMQSKGQGNNPITNFLAKLYATFIDTNNDLEAARAELNKGKKIAAVNNGPTGSEIDKGEKVDTIKDIGDQPFDPLAFEAVMNRGR